MAITTTAGEIEAELFEDDAPNTVNNFIELTEKKFYDGLLFHRIIKNFMIQGGDPQGTGMGGPGYKFPDEVKNNPNKHDPYSLSMANSGPSTNGSQFFIVTNPQGTSHLDGRHTVFGKVTKGKEVVDKLNASPTAPGDRPDPEVKILSIKVLNKRSHPYAVRNKVADPGAVPPPPIKIDTKKADEKKPDESKTDEKKPDEKKADTKPATETKPETKTEEKKN